MSSLGLGLLLKSLGPQAVMTPDPTVEFSLMGFAGNPELQLALFTAFLVVYLMTLLGNLGIIILIRTSPQLHSPMYYFLGNLALVDLLYSTVVTPKLLSDLVRQKPLSYVGCVTQVFVFSIFLVTECFLLATMAYDRYMAVSHPLHYSVLMSPRVRTQLVVGSYTAGGLNALVHTAGLLRLSFCGPNVVNHFYCEIPPLLPLSCSETQPNEVVMVSCAAFIITTTGLAILTSYAFILLTVWSTRSGEGRHKACSTCTSHLMAVALLYSSAAFLYLHPLSSHAEEERKTASVFYTVVIPMLNPFIYSLRNVKVRIALRRAVRNIARICTSNTFC
uniref:Olfactory receptor n=1 Tax=Anas zonorhyncha TaxID=75864 RepID=A0A8B9V723_9AVES